MYSRGGIAGAVLFSRLWIGVSPQCIRLRVGGVVASEWVQSPQGMSSSWKSRGSGPNVDTSLTITSHLQSHGPGLDIFRSSSRALQFVATTRTGSVGVACPRTN
jgi:hypothetical protein